jgi:hypothetical protein
MDSWHLTIAIFASAISPNVPDFRVALTPIAKCELLFQEKRETVTSAASRLLPGLPGRDSRERLPLTNFRGEIYAALLGPFASRVLSLPTFTLICFGLASAFFGSSIFKMPLS